MSELKITRAKDQQFGNVVSLEKNGIRIDATLDFGPRFVHLSLNGGENMLFRDTTDSTFLDFDLEPYGENRAKIYGGHRLWIAPELHLSTYYPDNYPVNLTETDSGVILAAPVEKFNNIQKIIEINFCGDCNKVKVIHSVKNCGSFDVTFAPWALSVMAAGGLEILPQPDKQTGLLGNRVFGMWPYSDMSDDRIYFGKKYITLQQKPGADNPFKFGYNNEKGWGAYINFSQIFVKEYTHNENAVYPDFGVCSYETYTNAVMLEMETLGELKTVKPGEVINHEEKWSLYPMTDTVDARNEKAIENILENFGL